MSVVCRRRRRRLSWVATSSLESVGQQKGNLNSANFLQPWRILDRAVMEFIAPRGSCEMMITVVETLDPLKPVELGTRLAAGAGRFK
jgi:hypothetical protein